MFRVIQVSKILDSKVKNSAKVAVLTMKKLNLIQKTKPNLFNFV